jgi:hypothetical protein
MRSVYFVLINFHVADAGTKAAQAVTKRCNRAGSSYAMSVTSSAYGNAARALPQELAFISLARATCHQCTFGKAACIAGFPALYLAETAFPSSLPRPTMSRHSKTHWELVAAGIVPACAPFQAEPLTDHRNLQVYLVDTIVVSTVPFAKVPKIVCRLPMSVP